MIDPLTALSIASAAVGQIKSLLSAGRDCSGALGRFAGALADVNHLAESAKDPPFYKSFTGSAEKEAVDAFLAKKQTDALKKDVEVMIMYTHGMQGLEDYKKTIRKVKAHREEHEFKRLKIKETLISWTFGILIIGSSVALAGWGIYIIGHQQHKW